MQTATSKKIASMVRTRSGALSTPSPPLKKQKSSAHDANDAMVEQKGDKEDDCESNLCSICIMPLSDNDAVKLTCSHAFHGQCIVDALHRSSKCPLCRFPHARLGDDTPSFYDQEGEILSIISTRLRRMSGNTLNGMLADFDINPRYTRGASRLAKCQDLAVQLLYETDSDAED